MNRLTLTGRLRDDPEFKKSPQNISIVNFILVVPRKYNKEEVDFFRCCAYKASADYLNQYIKKGDLIAIEGRLQSRTYEDKANNKTINVVEVIIESVELMAKKRNQEQIAKEFDEYKEFENVVGVTDEDLPF